jgi:hypothetical protein
MGIGRGETVKKLKPALTILPSPFAADSARPARIWGWVPPENGAEGV